MNVLPVLLQYCLIESSVVSNLSFVKSSESAVITVFIMVSIGTLLTAALFENNNDNNNNNNNQLYLTRVNTFSIY